MWDEIFLTRFKQSPDEKTNSVSFYQMIDPVLEFRYGLGGDFNHGKQYFVSVGWSGGQKLAYADDQQDETGDGHDGLDHHGTWPEHLFAYKKPDRFGNSVHRAHEAQDGQGLSDIKAPGFSPGMACHRSTERDGDSEQCRYQCGNATHACHQIGGHTQKGQEQSD